LGMLNQAPLRTASSVAAQAAGTRSSPPALRPGPARSGCWSRRSPRGDAGGAAYRGPGIHAAAHRDESSSPLLHQAWVFMSVGVGGPGATFNRRGRGGPSGKADRGLGLPALCSPFRWGRVGPGAARRGAACSNGQRGQTSECGAAGPPGGWPATIGRAHLFLPGQKSSSEREKWWDRACCTTRLAPYAIQRPAGSLPPGHWWCLPGRGDGSRMKKGDEAGAAVYARAGSPWRGLQACHRVVSARTWQAGAPGPAAGTAGVSAQTGAKHHLVQCEDIIDLGHPARPAMAARSLGTA